MLAVVVPTASPITSAAGLRKRVAVVKGSYAHHRLVLEGAHRPATSSW
jgi:hypothetical protein